MYYQAFSWSWLCVEATQVIFWCVNQILLPQTWYNGHFLRFKRHFEVFCLLGALKVCLSDHHLRSCGPRKKFLWELLAPNMCSGTSSWSYLRAKTNGVTFGCFNVMIWLQTWANGNFLDFIPSQRRLQGKFHWNRAKIVFWWSATLPLWAVKIFSTHY